MNPDKSGGSSKTTLGVLRVLGALRNLLRAWYAHGARMVWSEGEIHQTLRRSFLSHKSVCIPATCARVRFVCLSVSVSVFGSVSVSVPSVPLSLCLSVSLSLCLLAALGGSWLPLAALGCSAVLRAAFGCSWLLWGALGNSWLLLAVAGWTFSFLAAARCSGAAGCSWLLLAPLLLLAPGCS